MRFKKLRVLCYHSVALRPSGSNPASLYVSPIEFARQMNVLKRLGLRGVSLSEGLAQLRRGSAENCVALTFDDGYRDNVEAALPVLREFDFSATCYVVTDRLGGYNEWDAGKVDERKPLMDERAIDTWLAAGCEIGSHGRKHARLDQLDEEGALDEIAGSRKALARITGAEVVHFCYPYGRFGAATPALVQRAGYATATTTKAGSIAARFDPYRLPRIGIAGGSNFAKILLKLTLAR